jgi:hypothetical protein
MVQNIKRKEERGKRKEDPEMAGGRQSILLHPA